MYSKLAWRNIWRNKRRTAITLAAIAFAVFFASVMQSMQLGSYERMIENVVRFHTGYVQVHDSGYWDDRTLDKSFIYDQEVRKKLETVSGIQVAVPRLESFALAAFENQSKGALIIATDPLAEDQLTQLKAKIIDGEYLDPDDKAVLIGSGLAEYLKMTVGDTLILIGQGYHGVNAAGKYPIKGTVKFPAPDLNNQIVYLPLKEGQWLYGAEKRLTSLALVLPSDDEVNPVIGSTKQILSSDFEVMGWRDMLPELVQQIELDYVGGLIMLTILYTIIGFGIFGTFLMMARERKHEFGIMMAIGMKRIKLQIILLLETLMMAGVAVIIGILLSLPVATYFHFNPIPLTGEFADAIEKFGLEPVIPFSINPAIFLRQAQVIFGLTLVLSIYPIWSVFKLKIATAIRD